MPDVLGRGTVFCKTARERRFEKKEKQ